MQVSIKNTVVKIAEGDITVYPADAVFCPDCLKLPMTRGLAKVFREASGESLFELTRSILPKVMGDVVYVRATGLPFAYVCCGVVLYPDGEVDRDSTVSALRKTLRICRTLGLARVAFPVICSPSSKIPYDTFAHLILRTIIDALSVADTPSGEVSVVAYNREAFASLKIQLEILRQEFFI